MLLKTFKASKILTALFLSSASFAFANSDDAELVKYQQARIAVSYKGNVGDLAQQLAEKLGIGYYAAQHNSTVQVKLKQDDSHTLQDLINQANQQLEQQKSPQQLRFDLLDDKVVLALVGNNVSLTPKQFIGNVLYANGKAENSAIAKEENTISTPVIVETKSIDEPKKTEGEKLEVPQPKSEVNDAEAKKLREILDLSQDNKLLAQYAKRKTPSYQVQDQQALGLETIRSTKISSFFIFKDDIDVAKLTVSGEFQDIAKMGNVIAILHRQKAPPKEIVISTSDKAYKLTRVN